MAHSATPVVAIVLAAGFGTRFDPENPKQLISIGGEAMISRTIRIFETNPSLTDIVVGVNPQVRDCVATIVADQHFSKVHLLVDGGKERSDSSYLCLKELADRGIPSDAKILIHDGARPFTSQETVERCVAGLDSFDALSTAVRSTDTIFVTATSEKGTVIDSVPERDAMYRAQTPQAFRFHTIYHAYQRAMADPVFRATDDVGVVNSYAPQVAVGIVEGSKANMKVTTFDDLPMAEWLSSMS